MHRRMLTLPENMLLFTEWMRGFELETVSETDNAGNERADRSWRDQMDQGQFTHRGSDCREEGQDAAIGLVAACAASLSGGFKCCVCHCLRCAASDVGRTEKHCLPKNVDRSTIRKQCFE